MHSTPIIPHHPYYYLGAMCTDRDMTPFVMPTWPSQQAREAVAGAGSALQHWTITVDLGTTSASETGLCGPQTGTK